MLYLPILFGLYQHYKGNLYQVIGVAQHSENHDIFVMYQALYDDYNIWIRPFDMFTETIVIDGKEQPRFTFLKETMTKVAPFEKR